MENANPQFTHNCDSCTFLGADIDTDTKTEVDMYFCSQNGIPTIIMRYGDNGEDYISAPISVINETDTYNSTPLLRNMLIAEDMHLWQRN